MGRLLAAVHAEHGGAAAAQLLYELRSVLPAAEDAGADFAGRLWAAARQVAVARWADWDESGEDEEGGEEVRALVVAGLALRGSRPRPLVAVSFPPTACMHCSGGEQESGGARPPAAGQRMPPELPPEHAGAPSSTPRQAVAAAASPDGKGLGTEALALLKDAAELAQGAGLAGGLSPPAQARGRVAGLAGAARAAGLLPAGAPRPRCHRTVCPSPLPAC